MFQRFSLTQPYHSVQEAQRSSITDVISQVPGSTVPETAKKQRSDGNLNTGYGDFSLHRTQNYMNMNITAEDVFGDCGCGGVVPEYENSRSGVSCAGNSELDESCSELEFINSQVPNGVVPFTPKRCSTPLKSVDLNVSNGFYGENKPGSSAGYQDAFNRNPGSILGSPNSQKQQVQHRRLPGYNMPLHSVSPYSNQYDGFMRVPDVSANSMGSFGGSPTRSNCTVGSNSPVSSVENHDLLRQQWNMTGSQVDGCAGRGVGCCGVVPVGGFRDRWAQKDPVEVQAQAYRLAASICVPNVVWSGILPARNCRGSAYSCKVFLGGVPWDITEANLNSAFGKFGPLKVEWPSNHAEHASRNSKGYLYIVFDNERSVRALLASCTQDFSNGNRNYYYKVCSNRLRRKDVQVIPWQLADSAYVRHGCMSVQGTKTVFVGSLHGMLNAEGLARIMDDLFGGVVAANVDTDKHKYPIGSGRVVFNCTHSYIKAIRAAFVELRTQKFSKKIQIDPFLEDSMCSICNAVMGPFFCRDMECFQYFCGTCWQWQHSVDNLKQHTPMMRNPRVHDSEF